MAESKKYSTFTILIFYESIFIFFDPFLEAFLVPRKHSMVKGNLNKKEKTKTETTRPEHESL